MIKIYKKPKFVISVISLFIFGLLVVFGLLFLGCGKHAEVPPGAEGINQKSAGFRTAGGGIEDKAYSPGRYKIGGVGAQSKMLLIPNTPQKISQKFGVIMPSYNNLKMTFDVACTYMVAPSKGHLVRKKLGKDYRRPIQAAFERITFEQLARSDKADLKDRAKMSAGIKGAMIQQVNSIKEIPAGSLMILDVAVGNINYPEEVLRKWESAAAAEYQKDVLDIRKQIRRA